MFKSEPTSRDEALQGELAEIGMDVVREFHAAMKAGTDPDAKAKYTRELDRAGRAVRRTLLVRSRLRKDQRSLARDDADQAAKARKAEVAHSQAQIRRDVARIAATTFEDADQIEQVSDQLEARLIDYARDLETRPLAEVAEAICADLGITFAPGDPRPWDPPPPAAASPRGLVQAPDFGWRPAPDSS